MAEMQMMEFPQTVDEFMESYKIVDTEQVYTNGSELVPIFRMRQWFEHFNGAEWISVKEKLPKYGDYVLGIGPKHGCYICEYRGLTGLPAKKRPRFVAQGKTVKITHWRQLPEPPEEEK